MTELRKKSVHDLRVMAQAFGITEIFEKDAVHLAQEIELKQQTLSPPPVPLPPKPEYDARLMTLIPSAMGSAVEITELLSAHIALGLKLSFDMESWRMAHGKKEDHGTLRMPLRNILICADKVLR